jgi:hypothetical protein
VSFKSWLKGLFTPRPATKLEEPLGRNDVCWCGSGKKYKRCHLREDDKHRFEAAYAARIAAARKGQAGGGGAKAVKPAPPAL